MIVLLAYWACYFSLHSLLASTGMKKRIAGLWPSLPYRLAYNVIAVVLLLPGIWLLGGQPWQVLWKFEGAWKYASYSLQILAAAGFLASLRYYDMEEFLGLKTGKNASFTISPFHRFVRHPWYCFGLVIIWSSDMNSGKLATDIMVTLYLFLGSMHEERMLIDCFGDSYAEYRKRVPRLFPLPWKYLSEKEARSLVK